MCMIMLVQLVLLDSLDNLERDSRPPTSLCSPTSNALLYHGHSMQTKMKKLLEQFSFLYLCTFPFNKLMSMCLHTKKRALSDSFFILVCGERGIRTPGASQLNGFQDRRNRPLCHLSFVGMRLSH